MAGQCVTVRLAMLGLLLSVAPAVADEQAAAPVIVGQGDPADVTQIQRIMSNQELAWRRFDAQAATADFARDAYWINAFGIERHGKAEIDKFVVHVLERFKNDTSRDVAPPSLISIRFVMPNVAMAHFYEQTEGQHLRDGTPVGLRRTHEFFTLAKQAGRWQVDSVVIMDERNRGSTPPSIKPPLAH